MQPGKDILDELRSLSSYIATLNKVVPFAVPEGYFDSRPAAILQGVLAADSDADITLPVAKANPYQTPQGYFDTLQDRISALIAEEKELSFLTKANTLSTPEGYFDQLPGRIMAAIKEEKPATKAIPLGNTIWKNVRWAAAAILVAGIGFGGYKMIQPEPAEPVTTASVEQKLTEIPDAALNKYIQQNIDDFDGDMIASVIAKNEKTTPVTKDQLTDKEIIDYLQETGWETSL